jgi:hypothetical protein
MRLVICCHETNKGSEGLFVLHWRRLVHFLFLQLMNRPVVHLITADSPFRNINDSQGPLLLLSRQWWQRLLRVALKLRVLVHPEILRMFSSSNAATVPSSSIHKVWLLAQVPGLPCDNSPSSKRDLLTRHCAYVCILGKDLSLDIINYKTLLKWLFLVQL